MLERDGYPPGVPCWIDTAQPDPEAAARFYGGLFGWEFEDRTPGRYLVARIDGRDVAAIGSQAGDAPPVWTTYVAVESADDAAAKVRDGGGTVLIEPSDVGDAGRMAAFADPSGAEFCVWQAGSRKGAQLVNHPGTWNWSDLNTQDLEGAKAFYGGLFGWEDSAVDFGMGEYTMWRVPGYAEVLERSDPDLRRRQDEAGAPAGFADAVAWLLPLGDDAAPRWAVTFAVDDADAVAARAAELGGTIDVPPFDAGPTRVAILSDPQGASFSVSRYDPGS